MILNWRHIWAFYNQHFHSLQLLQNQMSCPLVDLNGNWQTLLCIRSHVRLFCLPEPSFCFWLFLFQFDRWIQSGTPAECWRSLRSPAPHFLLPAPLTDASLNLTGAKWSDIIPHIPVRSNRAQRWLVQVPSKNDPEVNAATCQTWRTALQT